MRYLTLLFLMTLSFGAALMAQKVGPQTKGAHELQLELYGHPEFKTEDEYDHAQGIDHRKQHILSKNCILQKQVYGWHPAWSGTAYQQYDYAMLSTVGYYAYVVNPKTGWPLSTHQWRETQMVEMAHNAGSQVELTAALFGSLAIGQLLKNPKACENLGDSLITLLKFKDADGICIDFQGLAPAQKGSFVKLIADLTKKLHEWRKDATITITLPAVDATLSYDIAALSPYVNRFIVLAYDFHGANSAEAGPVAALRGSNTWGESGLVHSLRLYLDAGAPKNKLIAAVPYYGYRWAVADQALPAKTKGPGQTVLLRQYEAMDSSSHLNWDSSSVSGWLPNAAGQANSQLWIDQVSSLNEKFGAIKSLGIAGTAIWALGYDHGQDRYWNLLKGEFADCGAADSDALRPDSDQRHPALQGETSAERNTWNWVWMLGGGTISVVIIWLVKKYL